MKTGQQETDVLVAEDDAEDLFILELAIAETSYSIALRHAIDGTTLFEKLKEAIPDLLFLDINMPCKDGVSCLLEIRKNPAYNKMPVVMLTAHRRSSYIMEAYKNGANFYLLKQPSFQALVEKLRYIFSMNWDEQLYFPPLDKFLLE